MESCNSDGEGYYVPCDFPEPLPVGEADGIEGGWVGSSVRLLAECRHLAECLQIPPGLGPDSSEIWEAIRRLAEEQERAASAEGGEGDFFIAVRAGEGEEKSLIAIRAGEGEEKSCDHDGHKARTDDQGQTEDAAAPSEPGWLCWPHQARTCLCLLRACEKSIETGAAVVFA